MGFLLPVLCIGRSLIEKFDVGNSSILDSEIYVHRVKKSFDIIHGR